jgi:NADPH-dependent glutamate synthase beta subunit-like oxidoreductase
MELGTLDDTGRRTPVPVGGSEFDMELDMVIPAVGQVVDADLLSWEDGETKGGRLLVAPDSMITAHDGVFAGGDAVTGPRNAIEAIAAGKEAAASINNYLGGL